MKLVLQLSKIEKAQTWNGISPTFISKNYYK